MEYCVVESDARAIEPYYPLHVIKMPKTKEVTFKKTENDIRRVDGIPASHTLRCRDSSSATRLRRCFWASPRRRASNCSLRS